MYLHLVFFLDLKTQVFQRIIDNYLHNVKKRKFRKEDGSFFFFFL